MKDQFFAVVDVETTGGGINGNRLTEICVVLMKGDVIIEKYTTLINPEKQIPFHITGLTGIDNAMVANAPKFREVAGKIEEITRDAVFVAHNVNFDYNVLRNEFKDIGLNFVRKKLCTVRLSRKLIPGLLSYSLGRLCDSINIPLVDRHRAEGDTDATVILFGRLLSLDEDYKVMRSFLHAHSRQATLPPHLCANQIYDLPESPGVYLFKDKNHKVIYVGKAINIKKRVISHFYDKVSKEYHLGQETYHIDHENTGNELIALLQEAEYIRKYYPRFNRAQKNPGKVYQIISYINQLGVIQLALGTTKLINNSIGTFYNRAQAMEKLEQLCETYKLCPRFCTLQSNVEVCSHYRIKNCEGICEKQERVEVYNQKVKAAISSLTDKASTYVIKEKGRHSEEEAFIYIKEGSYCGFGYVEKEVQILEPGELEPFLKLQAATYHTNMILSSYLRKKGESKIFLPNPEVPQISA